MADLDKILQDGLHRSDVLLSENQRTVVDSLLLGSDVLYIDRTGAGKSETYFVATKQLRSDSVVGPVIVVSPLVALMDEQVRRATDFGLTALAFHGKLTVAQKGNVCTKLKLNKIDLLFLTPEMLSVISNDVAINPFNDKPYHHKLLKAAPALKKDRPKIDSLPWYKVPLLVIDEIHCITEDGVDFRLDFAQVWGKLEDHPWYQNTCKLGLTATVNDRIWTGFLGALPEIENWKQVLGNLYRPNIALRVHPKPKNANERLNFVLELHQSEPESFILVFCKKKEDVIKFYEQLLDYKVPTGYYMSINSCKTKDQAAAVIRNEEKFRSGEIKVLFSTCALGLGYDKADIHHVVHLWTPNSLVQYYQEFGRAGRSSTGELAKAHMLPTTTWNPSGWVPALGDLVYFLGRNGPTTIKDVKDRQRQLRRFKEADYNNAIDLGIKKKLIQSSNNELSLKDVDKSLMLADELYADEMKTELQVINAILYECPGGGKCLWSHLLAHFKGSSRQGLSCGKCSVCLPGNDISAVSQSVSRMAYKMKTKHQNVSVFALCQAGEDPDLEDDMLRDLFALHHPNMIMDPPAKWTICVIPDSNEQNVAEAETYAEWLHGMEINSTLIEKNPEETRKVTEAKSAEERASILETKFIYNWDKMPQIGNILLYDDKTNSGETIDSVASKLRLQSPNLEITALVYSIYRGNQNQEVEEVNF